MKARLYKFNIGQGERVMIVRRRLIDALDAMPKCLQARIVSMKSQPVTLSSKPTK
jgi:hypothetical protein